MDREIAVLVMNRTRRPPCWSIQEKTLGGGRLPPVDVGVARAAERALARSATASPSVSLRSMSASLAYQAAMPAPSCPSMSAIVSRSKPSSFMSVAAGLAEPVTGVVESSTTLVEQSVYSTRQKCLTAFCLSHANIKLFNHNPDTRIYDLMLSSRIQGRSPHPLGQHPSAAAMRSRARAAPPETDSRFARRHRPRFA